MAEYTKEELMTALESAKAAGDEKAVVHIEGLLTQSIEPQAPETPQTPERAGGIREKIGAAMEAVGGGIADFNQRNMESDNKLRQAASVANPLNLIEDSPEARAARQGATFGYSDEIAGLLGGKERAEDARAKADQYREERPMRSMVLEAAGGMASTAPLGAVGLASKAGPGIKAAKTIGAGGAGGATAGAGYAEPGERAEGAAIGAGVGMATGALFSTPVADVAGEVFGYFGPKQAEKFFRNTILKRQSKSAVKKGTLGAGALEKKAKELYEKAASDGVTAPQELTGEIYDTVRGMLDQEGIITPSGAVADMPKVRHALKMLEDFSEGSMSPKQLQTVRKALSAASQSVDGSEARAGAMMIQNFDIYTSKLSPQLLEANKLWHRASKGRMIEQAITLAEDAAGTNYTQAQLETAVQRQIKNTILTPIRKGKLKGWTDAEVKAIEKIVRGSAKYQAARTLGSLAPSRSTFGTIMSGAGGAAGATMMGLPPLAGAAGALSLGKGGQMLASKLQREAIDTAEALILSGIPEEQVAKLSVGQRELLAAQVAARMSDPAADMVQSGQEN